MHRLRVVPTYRIRMKKTESIGGLHTIPKGVFAV